METLSCSLSLAEVTGRGYQREGFSGFLRAITVTERAIARSVDGERPISATTSDSLRSSSVRAQTERFTSLHRRQSVGSTPRSIRSSNTQVSFFTLDPLSVQCTHCRCVALAVFPVHEQPSQCTGTTESTLGNGRCIFNDSAKADTYTHASDLARSL